MSKTTSSKPVSELVVPSSRVVVGSDAGSGDEALRAARAADLVIFDIDDTLSDPAHRLHLLGAEAHRHSCLAGVGRVKIETFMHPDQVINDAPIQAAVRFIASLQIPQHRWRFLTARWQRLGGVTREWLLRHFGWEHAIGYMRPDNDDGLSHELKLKILRDKFKKETHLALFDDDDKMIAGARKLNIEAFKAPGCF